MNAEHRVERVELDIDTRTVDTGWDLRDAFLRSGVMFDTAHYPRMHFRSKRVVYEGTRLAAVEGDVTLRGITHGVRFDVIGINQANNTAMKCTLCYDRLQGGLTPAGASLHPRPRTGRCGS